MKLKVIASGSKANSYILENEKEALVIEAGVPFKELIRHVDHRKIVGCLVSHEHKDHAAYVGQYQMRGINTFTPYTVQMCDGLLKSFGQFRVKVFENKHDVKCCGFYIRHNEMGNLVFATDTEYVEPKFKNINHWLVECNNSQELLDKSLEDKRISYSLYRRIIDTHMGLYACKLMLSENDLSKTRNIVLLHLSDGNSNAEQFRQEIHELTKKDTYIAEKGLEVDLSLCPL